MDFSKFYIIPDKADIEPYMELSKKYGVKFEYNDFFIPTNLDKQGYIEDAVAYYKNLKELPEGNTLHGAFLDVTIFSSDDKITEVSEFRMRQSMDIAKKLGARAVIFHTNFIPNFKDDVYEERWVDCNYYMISRLLEEYKDISIFVENMFDMDYELILRLAKMMSDNDRFGICLDYAHAKVFGINNTGKEWIEALAPYVKHIHINDNELKKDSHMALGKGLIDYKEFFELYSEYLSEATVLIEVRGLDKIKDSIEYIEKITH